MKPEGYKPTPGEVYKAESSLTPEQRTQSEDREKSLRHDELMSAIKAGAKLEYAGGHRYYVDHQFGGGNRESHSYRLGELEVTSEEYNFVSEAIDDWARYDSTYTVKISRYVSNTKVYPLLTISGRPYQILAKLAESQSMFGQENRGYFVDIDDTEVRQRHPYWAKRYPQGVSHASKKNSINHDLQDISSRLRYIWPKADEFESESYPALDVIYPQKVVSEPYVYIPPSPEEVLNSQFQRLTTGKGEIYSLILRVEDGVIEEVSDLKGEGVEQKPNSFVSGSRAVNVQGNRLAVISGGSGNILHNFELPDGLYILARNGDGVMQIERDSDGNLKPIKDIKEPNGQESQASQSSAGKPESGLTHNPFGDVLKKFRKE